MVPFTRQLGAQPGVQLNPLRDNSDGFAPDNSDQAFAIMMRATRGRIDKPFRVNASNFKRLLGKGESVRASVLNEAWIHVGEALNKGAYEAVVKRLVTDSAVLSHIAITAGNGAVLTATVSAGAVTAVSVVNGGTGFASAPTISFGGPGTGATATATVSNGAITSVAIGAAGTGYTSAPTVTAVPTFAAAVSANIPSTPYMMTVKLLDCVNEGAKIELHADSKQASGVDVDNTDVVFRVREITGEILYEFEGSLSSTAVDDYGQSRFLPDVIERSTDAIQMTVATGAAIAPGSAAYGRDSNGQNKVFLSPTQVYFSEGGTGYTTANYLAAKQALQNTEYNYGYIASGGSQNAGLLAQLFQLAYDTNRICRFDIDGTLSPAAAITFMNSLNVDSHYMQAFWSPLKSNDPMGINGKLAMGTSTFNIARSCLRNAQVNGKGFAPKNYPIAGKEWPLDRTGIVQIYSPSEQELSDLAKAKINPVISERYASGSRYVFTDSLTTAKTDVSFRKLASVAEMSSTIDSTIAGAAKEVLQFPMTVAVKKMQDFLKNLFEGAESSGWVVPSEDLGGAAYLYEVKPNEQRPADRMDITHSVRYDGTLRQVTITQTISR